MPFCEECQDNRISINEQCADCQAYLPNRPVLTDAEFDNARIHYLAGELLPLIDTQINTNADLDTPARLDLVKLQCLVENTRTMARQQEIPSANIDLTIASLEFYISKYTIPTE